MDIYEMKLHEIREVCDYTTVLRVPGGWIYTQKKMEFAVGGRFDTKTTSVFVPFDNEFRKRNV